MKKLQFETSVASKIYQRLKKEGFFDEFAVAKTNGEEGMIFMEIEPGGLTQAVFANQEQAMQICDIVAGLKEEDVNEADLKKTIKKDFDKKGAWSYAPVQHGMGANGIPDRIICMPTVIKQEDVGKTMGLFVGAEAKMKGNKPTKLQTVQLKGIAKAGGVALVITGEKGKPYKIERVEG